MTFPFQLNKHQNFVLCSLDTQVLGSFKMVYETNYLVTCQSQKFHNLGISDFGTNLSHMS